MPPVEPRLHGFKPGLGAAELDAPVFTYALYDGQAIKIGKCNGHPLVRLRCLQTGNSRPLELVAYTRGDGGNGEARVHRRLRRHKLRGEWFEVCLAVLAELREWAWLNEGLYRQLRDL